MEVNQQTESIEGSDPAVGYTGILNWSPNTESPESVAISDILTVVSLFVADIWSVNQCKDKLKELVGRDLVQAEVDDIVAIAQYVKDGGMMAECRLQRVRNGLEAIERGFGLSDSEIRQLAGI